MSDQLALFTEPAARHDNPPTSVAAAEAVAPYVDKLEAKILAVYETYGPCTDELLCIYMAPWHSPTVVTARSRLKKRGLMEPVPKGVNTMRGESPAARYARADHCPNGHPYEGNVFYRRGRRCRTCDRAKRRRYLDRKKRGLI